MGEVIYLQEEDDMAVLRSRLRRAQNGRVVLVLPWDARLLSRPLDGELVRREAERLGLEVAVVCEDPDRRALVRWSGLPAFSSVSQAEAAPRWPRPSRRPISTPTCSTPARSNLHGRARSRTAPSMQCGAGSTPKPNTKPSARSRPRAS
ncbi:MAG TPA: hypothetical protein EYP77_05545, partial [Anaerolineae bacterium]|nr:hypothetical protein [Anaerolineae bacterium]